MTWPCLWCYFNFPLEEAVLQSEHLTQDKAEIAATVLSLFLVTTFVI